jgi:hypothetical protein
VISLRFGEKAVNTIWPAEEQEPAKATLVQHSVRGDWALLKLSKPAPPYPAHPLPLAGVRFDPNPVIWETWGFPMVPAQEFTGYEGFVY